MRLTLLAQVGAFLIPVPALAFCDPPIAPSMTTEAMARDYKDEFRDEFEQYFSDAQNYFKCLEEERHEVMAEINETAFRYKKFLEDSDTWE